MLPTALEFCEGQILQPTKAIIGMGLTQSSGLGKVRTRTILPEGLGTRGSCTNPKCQSLLKEDVCRKGKRSPSNRYSLQQQSLVCYLGFSFVCFSYLPVGTSLRLDFLHLTFLSISSCPLLRPCLSKWGATSGSSPFPRLGRRTIRNPRRMLFATRPNTSCFCGILCDGYRSPLNN